MPTTHDKLTEDELPSCILWWQRVLNLLHWRVEYCLVAREKMKIKNAVMYITPTRERSHAMIYIRSDALQKYDSIAVQKLIVHELTHLIYDPIAEEHGFQTQFDMDPVRNQQNKIRFTRVLERAVEHTAQMLCKALPIRVEGWDEYPEDPLDNDCF